MQFVELMNSKYGEQAKEAGVYIVNFCGFDCIPNDLGALVLHKAFNGTIINDCSRACNRMIISYR